MGSLRKPDETRKIIHVYMVSFPGQGHVNPLLRLGKRLADFGLFVTLCTPEFAGESIRKANNISGDADPTQFGPGMIQFEFFDDGWDFNNPNRHDLTSYMAQLELVGRQKIPEMIKKQSEMGRPVSCLINNPFIPWVSDMAEDLGIPSALLWIQSCASFAAYYYYYNKLVPFPTEEEPEIDIEIPHMPLLKYDEIPSFLHPSSPYPFLAGAILGQFKNLKKPFCILMETFQDLENEIVQHMSEICCPIKTVGPLCSELKRNHATEDESVILNSKSSLIRSDFFTAEKSCVEWLELKPPRSVVYISFGSVVHLKQEQIDELALGLVASEVSFLWVLRPPPREFTEEPHVLPEGFLEKVGDKGKIVQWSPQEEVLAHPSTACFLTHCGWNSTMEVLASGVPVVAFPQWGDQVTDAMFLVDVFKVGFRLCRGEAEDKIVSRDEVERCLREATSGPEAAEIRENALKWKKAAEEAVSEGGSTFRNMQDFVEQVTRIGCNL